MIFDRSFSCLDGDVDSFFFLIFLAKDLHFAWIEEKNDRRQNEK